MSDPEHLRGARFPWVALALCLACVAAAVWLWMRYSYCWDMRPREFYEIIDTERLSDCPIGERAGGETGRYVRISGNATGYKMRLDPLPRPGSRGGTTTRRNYIGLGGEDTWEGPVFVRVPRALDWPGMQGKHFTFTGRVIRSPPRLLLSAGRYPRYVIDSTRSRFHAASISGLVVGAWGVFIFTTAFLHWRK